ncbi:MAG: hypothetical protein AB1489_09975 [Acidobacteriota bacterium]
MKKQVLLLLTLLWVCTVYAQNNTTQVDQIKLANVPDLNGLVGIKTVTVGSSGRPSEYWRVEFRIKNLSSRTIAKIDWQFKVADSLEEVLSKQFHNKQKVKPEKDSIVVQEFRHPLKNLPSYPRCSVELLRIEYEDGNFWENSNLDNEKR